MFEGVGQARFDSLMIEANLVSWRDVLTVIGGTQLFAVVTT